MQSHTALLTLELAAYRTSCLTFASGLTAATALHDAAIDFVRSRHGLRESSCLRAYAGVADGSIATARKSELT